MLLISHREIKESLLARVIFILLFLYIKLSKSHHFCPNPSTSFGVKNRPLGRREIKVNQRAISSAFLIGY